MNANHVYFKSSRWILAAALAVAYACLGDAHAENDTVNAIATTVSSNTSGYFLGLTGTNNVLWITNGGKFTVGGSAGRDVNIGASPSSISNAATVAGAGSMWIITNTLFVGYTGSMNSVTITNGGLLRTQNANIGQIAGALGNAALVSGSGSIWSNSVRLNVGNAGSFSILVVSNGGAVYNSADAFVGRNAASSNNTAIVTGAGSVWSNATELYVGQLSISNRLTVADGGSVYSSTAFIGSNAAFNTAIVTGTNSQWRNGGIFYVGLNGSTNALTITNGGLVSATDLVMGNNAASVSNRLGIYGGQLVVTNTSGNGVLDVRRGALDFNGGALVADMLYATNGASSLFNFNGGNLSAKGALVSNGATFAVGDGTQAATYTMLGGTHTFRQGLLVRSSGSLLVSNSTTVVDGLITNSGTIRTVNSTVTWQKGVVIKGGYISDPSTNMFTSNVVVTGDGYLVGSNGDLFVFQKDFINESTNRSQFSLWRSAVLFTNSGTHLLSVSNSGSADWGTGFTNFDRVSTNFAIGQLSIASGNRVTLAGNKDVTGTNALYVGWLDIQGGFDTNDFSAVTNALFNALLLPNINLYYDRVDPRNGWLNANLIGSAAGGYALWSGGGLLLPIPEPSSLMLMAISAGLALAFRRHLAS